VQLRTSIDAMFQSLFLLSKDQVDYTQFTGALAKFDPAIAIRRLRRIPVYKVDSGDHFQVEGHGLSEFAGAFKKLSRGLDDAEFSVRFEKVKRELQAIADACEEPISEAAMVLDKVRTQINQFDLHHQLHDHYRWSIWDDRIKAIKDLETLDLTSMKESLDEVLAQPEPQDIFQYISFARRADTLIRDERYQVLLAARQLLTDLQDRLGRKKGELSPLHTPKKVLALTDQLEQQLEQQT
jgi:hypothetical protein